MDDLADRISQVMEWLDGRAGSDVYVEIHLVDPTKSNVAKPILQQHGRLGARTTGIVDDPDNDDEQQRSIIVYEFPEGSGSGRIRITPALVTHAQTAPEVVSIVIADQVTIGVAGG